MVLLHSGFLVAMLVEAWVRRPEVPPTLAWTMLALVLASRPCAGGASPLGRRWNTRVIIVPGLPPVTSGPYRFLSHPNYVAVVVEGIALPLVHGAWVTALVFTVAPRCWPSGSGSRTPRCGRCRAVRRCVTCSSRAAGRSAWPPRCTPPGRPRRRRRRAPGRRDRQGVRRGADAGRGGGPVRPRRPPRRPPDRGDPLPRRHADGRGDVPARAGPRRPSYDAAPGAARGRAGRGRADRGGAPSATSRTAATTCSSTASPRATSWRPTGCTRRSAACSAWTPRRRTQPLRPALPRRRRALDLVRRGALVAVGGGLRHPGRTGPGGRRRAHRRTPPCSPTCSATSRCWRSASPAPGEQVRGAGPLRQRARRRVAGRVLLVGDASGYVDALTGEGIALGLAHARAAVAAVRAGEPRRYEREWRRLGWRTRLLTHGLPAATRHRASAPASSPPRPSCRASSRPRSTSSRGRHERRAARGAGGPPRRAGGSHRDDAQARRAPRGHPAAPGLLLLPLRRHRPAADDAARPAQAHLAGRVDQQRLRAPGAGQPIEDAVRRRVLDEVGVRAEGSG